MGSEMCIRDRSSSTTRGRQRRRNSDPPRLPSSGRVLCTGPRRKSDGLDIATIFDFDYDDSSCSISEISDTEDNISIISEDSSGSGCRFENSAKSDGLPKIYDRRPLCPSPVIKHRKSFPSTIVKMSSSAAPPVLGLDLFQSDNEDNGPRLPRRKRSPDEPRQPHRKVSPSPAISVS